MANVAFLSKICKTTFIPRILNVGIKVGFIKVALDYWSLSNKARIRNPFRKIEAAGNLRINTVSIQYVLSSSFSESPAYLIKRATAAHWYNWLERFCDPGSAKIDSIHSIFKSIYQQNRIENGSRSRTYSWALHR